MCPSAPRVCSEPGDQKPVLSLSLDRIGHVSLVAITGCTTMLPYHFVKLLLLMPPLFNSLKLKRNGRCFQMHFLECKLLNFTQDFFEICWCQIVRKSYSESLLTLFTCEYIRDSAWKDEVNLPKSLILPPARSSLILISPYTAYMGHHQFKL